MHTPKLNLALAQWLNKAIDIGIVPSENALYVVNGVYCCCLFRTIFKLVKVLHYRCLVGRCHVESSNVYAAQRLNCLFQLRFWNSKCYIGTVESFGCKSGVLHCWRQRVMDWIAYNAISLGRSLHRLLQILLAIHIYTVEEIV